MADYSKVIGWSGKDNLADSNAAKIISGADFHTEFTAVEAAVNTKADINGDAAEAFSATTASVSTNTTQVATTAFVTAAITAVKATLYPVGSIYYNAEVATNPATLLGFGTWEAYAAGRVPVGKAGSGTFDTLDATGGAETHTLLVSEMPSHSHTVTFPRQNTSGGGGPVHPCMDNGTGGPVYPTVSSTGGDGAHNNLQPYIVVYMWKRTA